MNIGIRLHDMAPGTLNERSAIAKQQGFSCVHLALSKTISPDLMAPAAATPGLASSVVKMLDGLDIAVLGCYLNLAHPDEKEYQSILKKYRAHMQLGRWMNAGVVGTETPMPEYLGDLSRMHSREVLDMYIRRLAPVVECAEQFGVTFAIEPVYTHIVYGPKAARYVLDAIGSDNLKIILDPVNLLHPDNFDHRDNVIAEAIDLLGEDTMVVHMKDYVPGGEKYTACACGTGVMNYLPTLRFIKNAKPYVHVTLENTKPENAEAARLHLEELAASL